MSRRKLSDEKFALQMFVPCTEVAKGPTMGKGWGRVGVGLGVRKPSVGGKAIVSSI